MTDIVLARGQLWIDNDPRIPSTRYVLIESIEGDKARCLAWYDTSVGVASARPTRIAVSRFRATATGYRPAKGEPKFGRPRT